MTSLPRSVQNGNSLETGSRLVVARAGAGGGQGQAARRFPFRVTKVFRGWAVLVAAPHCEGAECRPTVHCNAVRW